MICYPYEFKVFIKKIKIKGFSFLLSHSMLYVYYTNIGHIILIFQSGMIEK